MVLQFLLSDVDRPPQRQRKCGAEVAVGAGLGLASIVGGMFSSKSASDNNARSMAYNKWALQEQERYNKEMYEQQKADQEEYYKKYQSPQAIAQQLMQAGINPAAAVNGLTGGTGSAPSMPSVGSVSPNTAPALENTAQPLVNSVESAARSVASLASAQSQLKQGEKAAAETKETLSLLEHNVKSLMLQNAGQEAHNAYQELLNGFTKKYGDSEHALGIRQGLANILLASSQRDYNNALTSCQEVQEKLLKNQLKMSDEDVANYSYLLSLMTENVKKQGQVYDSEKASNYASAGLSKAQTFGQNIANKLQSIELDRESDDKVKAKRLSALLSDLSKSDQLSKAEREKAKTEFNRYKHLNENDKNSVAEFVNYNLWFIKENLKGLGFLLPLGKK